MAVTKQIETASLSIEIQSGVDKAGDPTFSKKTFSNVKTGANVEDIYAVAEAVKGVLSASTRSYLLNESSTIAQV
jgi:hypothetical protein